MNQARQETHEDVCPYCGGDGFIYKIDADGYEYAEPCVCELARRQKTKLARSGLVDINRQTLDKFRVRYKWQQDLKEKAEQYLQEEGRPWFFIGGQVGAGKTHLCTGICLELIDRGEQVRYEVWAKISGELKALRNEEEFAEEMKALQDIETLYLDDFFRRTTITESDRSLAWELLNGRYINGKRTIISSERYLEWITEIDEAIGSRIYQRTNGYVINARKEKGRNQRMEVSV
jgi:DNA replication protein DnaC